MEDTPYLKKLRDPRWQKIRLQIFNRDGWKCRECGESGLELQIHHCKYFKDPWDCPTIYLLSVCGGCHQKRQNQEGFIRDAMAHLSLKQLEKVRTMLVGMAIGCPGCTTEMQGGSHVR